MTVRNAGLKLQQAYWRSNVRDSQELLCGSVPGSGRLREDAPKWPSEEEKEDRDRRKWVCWSWGCLGLEVDGL